MERSTWSCTALALCALAQAQPTVGAVVEADPLTYRSALSALQPGDTLRLAAGTYTEGLSIQGLDGTADSPIVIEGPRSGSPAVFEARPCCNTISLRDSSHFVIRHLVIDGLGLAVDGVKAEGNAAFVHDITLDDLTIINHGVDQQIVGINTKCPTWGWVIRRCVIVGAGTGMYLGDSDGSAPFVGGVIEYNLVHDTLGYNLQVKHQVDRPAGPPSSARTVIRHNVFSKASGAAMGASARPNVLVGHWPLSGPGADDVYEIYGNVFHQNVTGTESLFQGEGNLALYQNLFVNDHGAAIAIQPHQDVPRSIRIFQNTVLAASTGIRVAGGHAGFTQELIGNAVFAATPLDGGTQQGNATGARTDAATHLVNPTGALGELDLYPRPGRLTGIPVPSASFMDLRTWYRDFNGTVRDGTFRGAYAGEGTNPDWTPELARKPTPGPVSDGARVPGDPLSVTRLDAAGEFLELRWDLPCHEAQQHVLSGPLEAVSTYEIDLSECWLASGGAVLLGLPGGSRWFLVVNDDDDDTQGSWGVDGLGRPRRGGVPPTTCELRHRDDDAGCVVP